MKKIKITTIILAIILVTLVAFAGVYVKTQNRMENKVKDYTFGREIKGARVVELKISTAEDTKPNEEQLTIENYETVKSTIEKRLNNFGAQDYTISLNQENGTIIVELPEDANTDTYVYLLTAPVKAQIKEKDANTELLSDSMVNNAYYAYTANAEGAYQVYLELHLTEEGQAKFEEIKNNYAVFADEVEEIEAAQNAEKKEKEDSKEGEAEEPKTDDTTTKETKKIAKLSIAGTEYDIKEIEKNQIIVTIGGETTNTVNVNNSMAAAAELATLISSGKYPVEYEIAKNRFVNTDITSTQLFCFAIAVAIIIFIIFVIFTIKYKIKGLLASISFIGFAAIFSLLLRYTNVIITIEGIGAIILALIINLKVNQMLLQKTNEIDYKELLKLVPIVIITLVFSFTGWENLSSFGMVMFWGLALIAGYNALVTKTLLKLKESK